MTESFLVFITACLVNNLVLEHLLGIDPVLGLSRKIDVAAGLSTSMLVLLPVASFTTWLFDTFVLRPFEMEFLRLFIFVVTVTLVIVMVDKILKKLRPLLHERIAVFSPLLMVNTSILGVALLNFQYDHGAVASVFFGIGSAAGFGIVIVVFTALRDRVSVADVPLAFQGPSILLITLGILSMAFLGFTGLA